MTKLIWIYSVYAIYIVYLNTTYKLHTKIENVFLRSYINIISTMTNVDFRFTELSVRLTTCTCTVYMMHNVHVVKRTHYSVKLKVDISHSWNYIYIKRRFQFSIPYQGSQLYVYF